MGEHKASLEGRIFKASIFILLAHGLFKLAALIQAVVMSRYLPPESFDVVYVVGFEGCVYMLFLIGEQLLGPSFLPVFMRERDTRSEESAWRFANTMLTIQFLVLSVIALTLCLAPHAVIRLITTWGNDSSPHKFEQAVRSIRMLAPAVIGLSLGSTTYMLLNSHKRFFLAAFGDAAWKFCAVIFLLVGALISRDGAQMLIWGLVAGSFCKVLTHLFGLRDKIRYFRPMLDWSHPALKNLCVLALPLIVGIIFSAIRQNFNNIYVPSALESAGVMQANSIGNKLQNTLLYLVPFTLSIAVFPFFCELVDKKDYDHLGRLVTRFGRVLLSVFIPFAFFVAVAAVPITSIIFKGGYFDAVAVKRTALSLSFYTFVLPAAAIEMLVMKAFFANRRMISVTVIGILFSSLSMAISWIGLKVSGGHDLVLLAFIAGGFTLSRTLKCLTLVEMLKKSAPVFPLREMAAFLARVSAATGVACGLAWLVLYRVGPVLDFSGRVAELVRLAVGGGVFGVTYLLCAYGLRIREMRELSALVSRKNAKAANALESGR